MSKYRFEQEYEKIDALNAIANELAEQNRLQRIWLHYALGIAHTPTGSTANVTRYQFYQESQEDRG